MRKARIYFLRSAVSSSWVDFKILFQDSGTRTKQFKGGPPDGRSQRKDAGAFHIAILLQFGIGPRLLFNVKPCGGSSDLSFRLPEVLEILPAKPGGTCTVLHLPVNTCFGNQQGHVQSGGL